MGETPLQVVDAMTDSPLGNLAFEWTMMKQLSDPTYDWTLDEIITWSMMYWIPGPYASMRHYREMALKGVHAGTGLGNVYPYIEVPVGLTEWPGDIWYPLVSGVCFSLSSYCSYGCRAELFPAALAIRQGLFKTSFLCIFSLLSKHTTEYALLLNSIVRLLTSCSP